MANVAISNLATTWSSVGTTYTAIKYNVTDTASAAGSLLLDLQIGGVSQGALSKGGALTLAGAATAAALIPTGSAIPTNGVYLPAANIVAVATNSTNRVTVTSTAVGIGVVPSTFYSFSRGLQFGALGYGTLTSDDGNNAFVELICNGYPSGSSAFKYVGALASSKYSVRRGDHTWSVAPVGVAGAVISYTQAMTLHASGGLSLGNTVDPGAGIMSFAAAKGVNFTANTPAAGMTSQLLNWYEEGTWTAVDSSGAGLSINCVAARYTRTGRSVSVNAFVIYPTTADTSNSLIGGLPFTSNSNNNLAVGSIITEHSISLGMYLVNASTTAYIVDPANYATRRTNANLSGAGIIFSMTYTI